jgi:hypothetical protein
MTSQVDSAQLADTLQVLQPSQQQLLLMDYRQDPSIDLFMSQLIPMETRTTPMNL